MSRTAEYALERMTASMGRQEQAEMQKSYRQACDDATMRAIVADNRNSVHLPANPAAKVVPADAGRVTTGTDGSGWAESRPLRASGGDGWAYMTPEERAERDRLEKERRAKGQS
jgi:hypothetical protein